MKKAEVTRQISGIRVAFSGDIAKQSVVSMVERCQAGQCDCMSSDAKQKIEGLEVRGEDGNVELTISGELTAEEIEAALAKSPLLHE